jgi:hypothetical protein
VTEPATFVAVTAEEIYLPSKPEVIFSFFPVVLSFTQSLEIAGLTVVTLSIGEVQLHQLIVFDGRGTPNQIPSLDSMFASTKWYPSTIGP